MSILAVFVFLSLVVGLIGSHSKIGFWGNFIFSLFLTPIVPLIFLLIGTDTKKE